MSKKKKNIVIIVASVLVLVIIASIFTGEVIIDNTYTVKTGEFENTITCKGEMKSQVYTKINMPDVMTDPDLNIYYLKINDLVEEGTIVKKGDYVGLLDQERIKSELNRTSDRLENYKNDFKMNKIDSTSTLTDARNNIQEMKYDLEYKELEIKQSVYESKSYQEKVKREYNRSVRKLEMAERDYQRSIIRHSSKCSYSEQRVSRYSEREEKLKDAVKEARILAPQDGMIIYAETWGRKRKKGDHVSFWSPEIAVLPDLTKLISKGYIEEVDIAKTKEGDKVRVVVDALPDKQFTGQVIGISAIGRDAKGVESKVFDIEIKIDGSDKNIAHGMSTSCEIITFYEANAVLVPLDYLFVNDTISVVYKNVNGKYIENEVEVAYTNDEYAMISEGLQSGDEILKEKPESN